MAVATVEVVSAYIYVGQSERGLKIGYSNDPTARLKTVAREQGVPVALVHFSDPMENAKPVEGMAHWLLRGEHIGGEWFSVDVEAAIAAIDQAIGLVAAGETAPQRVGNATPFAELKTVRLSVDLEAEVVALVDEWRRHQPRIPSRSAAIRMLVDRGIDGPGTELTRREREAKRKG